MASDHDHEDQQPVRLVSFLQAAVRHGNVERLQKVLLRGDLPPPPTSFSSWGAAALHLAIESNQVQVARYLIFSHGVNVEYLPSIPTLLTALVTGDETMLLFLLKETIVNVNVASSSGTTPIMYAAKRGMVDVVRFLAVDAGVDLEARDNQGRDLSCYAGMGGHINVVACLFDELKIQKREVLHTACGAGHLGLVQWLVLERGFDVHAPAHLGLMPLHVAALAGQLPVIQWLIIEARAPVNAPERKTGLNALHFACAEGHVEAVKWLVDVAQASMRVDRFVAEEPPSVECGSGAGSGGSSSSSSRRAGRQE